MAHRLLCSLAVVSAHACLPELPPQARAAGCQWAKPIPGTPMSTLSTTPATNACARSPLAAQSQTLLPGAMAEVSSRPRLRSVTQPWSSGAR